MRELISIILLLDGYKVTGESAHKRMIEYLGQNCKNFNLQETTLIDNLRIVRNKIAYDGYFVKENYIKRMLNDITLLVEKLKKQANQKLK